MCDIVDNDIQAVHADIGNELGTADLGVRCMFGWPVSYVHAIGDSCIEPGRQQVRHGIT